MNTIGDLTKRQAGILMPVFSIPSPYGLSLIHISEPTRPY